MIDKILDALCIRKIDGGIAVPPGYQLIPETVITPDETKLGLLSMNSIASLLEYLKAHAGEGTVLFADSTTDTVTAVFDWHELEYAGEGQHVATLGFTRTKAFTDWVNICGRQLTQRDFAEFVEEHLEHISQPKAADVLTIATTLQGKKNVAFKSGIRLQNGDQQIQWEEKTEAKTAGDIRVPSEIRVKLPVYRGCEDETTFEFKILFRYRIQDGRLLFELKMLGLEMITDLAWAEIVKALKDGKPAHVPLLDGGILTKPSKFRKESILTNNQPR